MAGYKGTTFAGNLLSLIFVNSATGAVAAIGSGLQAAVTPGTLYWSLHTADPTAAGNQTSNEIAYTSYARVGLARGAGWTVTGASVSPAAAVTFPAGTGGSGTASFFAIGTASSGVGNLLYAGTVTPNIVCGSGVTPQLTSASAITEA